MKKNKNNKIFKFVFYILLISYLVIYFSEITGYYEYQNHSKATLTEKQIRKFEADVSSGKEVDIKDYIAVNQPTYNNRLSKAASKISDGISKIVQGGVDKSFKFLSRLLDE